MSLLRRRAFTLIELLTVIAIIALLAAIIFPVFASVRGKARGAACLSNLRQIGTATLMYTQDYDGIVPYGKDASDAYVPDIWGGGGSACKTVMTTMPFLHYNDPVVSSGGTSIDPKQDGLLNPYLKNRDIWRCAADTGFDVLDNNGSCGGPCKMNARPSMYEKFGASYLVRTEVALLEINIDASNPNIGRLPNGSEVGLSQIQYLFDGNGSWHGSPLSFGTSGLRYQMLYLDGHAKSLTYNQYNDAWGTTIKTGSTTTGAAACL